MLRLSEIRFGDDYKRLANLIMMDADNRTNIGLVNLGPDDVTVDITAIPPDGPFIGSTTVALGPPLFPDPDSLPWPRIPTMAGAHENPVSGRCDGPVGPGGGRGASAGTSVRLGARFRGGQRRERGQRLEIT